MNPIRLFICIALLCFGGFITGCKTSQNTIRSSSIAVEGMIKGYSIYVVANKIPDAQQQPVWDAYKRYQEAEDQAVEAYTAFAVLGDADGWTKAKEALRQANLALMKLFPPEVNPVY